MDNENLAHLHNWVLLSGEKNPNDIMKFTGKWIVLEKSHSEWGNPDTERQTCFVFTYKCILDVKQMKTRLQSTVPEKLRNKEDTKRDSWILLGRENRWDCLGKLGLAGVKGDEASG